MQNNAAEKPVLVFATGNEHKLIELKGILPHFEILGLKDINLYEEIPESGTTLEENAWLKARFLFDKTGTTSLGEDTGLEVDFLHGAPGVISARYAGESKNSNKNMDKLIHAMETAADRSAQFRTIICLVDTDAVKYFEGIIRGKIAHFKSWQNGFGYDAIFIPDGYANTFAELDETIKNKISHRALAVEKLMQYLHVT